MPVHLIQGIFFQHLDCFGVGRDSDGDIAAVVMSGLCRFMYFGVIFPDPDDPDRRLIGEMTDHFGKATLFDIVLLPNVLRFVKRYTDRKDQVRYGFRREGSLWVGRYEGSLVGEGTTKCLVTRVHEGFFQSPE